MEIVPTCPLGHTCEEARDGKIYRCAWYVKTFSSDEKGNRIHGSEEDHCSIPILSIHLTELKKGSRGVQAAIESFRNEVSQRQDQLTAPTYKRIVAR